MIRHARNANTQETHRELSHNSLQTTYLILRALNSSSAACVTLWAMTAMMALKGIDHFPSMDTEKVLLTQWLKKMWQPIAMKEN